jgi:anaerobic selenocysteine-containing dehydrogenase
VRTRTHTVCRICHVACDLVVEFTDGQPSKVYGNKDNPVYRGYSCVKGRQITAYPRVKERLLQARKRQPDGSHAAIASGTALAEIAARIKEIVDRHGPRALAIYVGTHGYNNFAAHAYAAGLLQALGSPMLFNAVSIDQPGKAIGLALHGPWLAGTPPVDRWESLLLIGTNPIVSMNGGLGANPAGRLHDRRRHGMKLIVIDPRVTEVAAQADIHLQCRPGQDPAVLAGMVRIMLDENLHDAAFVADNAVGLGALREAVAPFTPDLVAARAGIGAADLLRAARLFAAGKSGAVSAGTGSNMSGHGNVTEYFVKVLTTLAGFWLRAGDTIPNPGVLINRAPPLAASPGPFPATGYGHKMRIRGLEETPAGLPTATLADEILLKGEGQVRALLVLGGNPVVAWPGQDRTDAAMRDLDLLVCFDPVLSATARLAHYVIAPKLGSETASITMHNEMFGNFGPGWGYDVPYAQYTEKLTDPPEGSDVVEEWEALHRIASYLSVMPRLRDWSIIDPVASLAAGTDIDTAVTPTHDDVMRIIARNAPVPYDEIKANAGPGRVYERPLVTVLPRPDGWTGRLDIGNADMTADLAHFLNDAESELDRFPFRLISRRLHDVVNSCWHDAPAISARVAGNGAYMHPDDLTDLGVADGDVACIASSHAQINAVLRADRHVRRGCISMSHAWGGGPGEDDDPRLIGACTARLIAVDREYDRFTGIPLMSAIPVRVDRVPAAA